MADVRTFTIRRKNNEEFTVVSVFARQEMARLLAEYEKELGPHKTLNVVPEFVQKFHCVSPFYLSVPASFCKNGMVKALHCIVTF